MSGNSGKVIIWDFDGTLVLPKGLWSGAMMAALDTLISDHNISIECLTPYLHTGFPWHEAGKVPRMEHSIIAGRLMKSKAK